MAEMRIIHRVVLPTFSVEIRTSDGKLSVAHCEYLRGVVEILTTQAVEDNEKPRLLAALADAGLEPAALNEGIPRDLKEAAEAPAKVAELQRDATELCDFLGFRVPPSKTPHEWLDQQVRSLKRSADWETQEHARHHQVEEELRATLAKVEAELGAVRAFFAEHGDILDYAACAGVTGVVLAEERREQFSPAYRAYQRLHNTFRPPNDVWYGEPPKGTTEP